MVPKNSMFYLIGLLLFIIQVQSIRWYMEPNLVKCLREELPAHTLLSGEYGVSEVPGQTVSFVARDTKGHILAHNDNIQHGKPVKFTAITETDDTVEMCFTSQAPSHQRAMKQEVSLVIKKGNDAKSYEGISEVAKLKPIEVELKKLEDLSEAIVQDFARMRKNEEDSRDTNESTNSRVLYFSIFSLLCLLGLATWQVFYLRRFFRAKKLIE